MNLFSEIRNLFHAFCSMFRPYADELEHERHRRVGLCSRAETARRRLTEMLEKRDGKTYGSFAIVASENGTVFMFRSNFAVAYLRLDEADNGLEKSVLEDLLIIADAGCGRWYQEPFLFGTRREFRAARKLIRRAMEKCERS